jgi:hypothetical protein
LGLSLAFPFCLPAMASAIDLLLDFCGSPKESGLLLGYWVYYLSVNDFTNTNKREWVHQNLIQGTMMTLTVNSLTLLFLIFLGFSTD